MNFFLFFFLQFIVFIMLHSPFSIIHPWNSGFEKQPQQRPDRLMSRLRSDDSFQRIVATRQPKGPDLGKGFSVNRTSKPKPSASYNSTDAGTTACKTPHQSASSTSPVSNSSASHDSSTSPESLASHNVVQASEDRAGLEEV